MLLLIAIGYCQISQKQKSVITVKPVDIPQTIQTVSSAKTVSRSDNDGQTSWSKVLKPGQVPDPYDIASFLDDKENFDLIPLWKNLGIADAELAGFFEKCYASCGVEQTNLWNIGEGGTKVILRIGAEWCYRYLIFGYSSVKPIFLGYVDTPYQKFGPPLQRVETIGERGIWLVLTTLDTTGTGGSLSSDNWYDISKKGVHNVLSYPSNGGETTFQIDQFGKSFDARVFSQAVAGARYTVDVLFSVEYTYSETETEDSLPLFEKKQRARYVWNPEADKFVFDRSHSQMTEKEMLRIYNIYDREPLTNEQFLTYNYSDLARLAISGKRSQKQWLSRFLKVCDRTSEEKGLSALLGR